MMLSHLNKYKVLVNPFYMNDIVAVQASALHVKCDNA